MNLTLDDSTITDDALGCATAHALEEYPRESCGLIVRVAPAEKDVYVRCQNTHETPEHNFRMNPVDYANACKLGEITALVHSHPDGQPEASEADKAMCEMSELPWHIITVHRDVDTVRPVGLASIAPCGYRAPLLGRPFVHGIHDCYALVRDWYADERGVDLPNFPREDKWWEKGGNLYQQHFADAGFALVDPADLQPGDVIIMQVRSPVWNHAGVYLGRQMFIHHFQDQLSRRDVYGGYWQKMTVAVARRMEA